MKVEFRCIGCGRVWRLAQSGDLPSCRDCGGELQSQAPEKPSSACPSCGQAHAADDAFCHSCGLAFGDGAAAPSLGDRERAVERRLAGIELGRHRSSILSLQRTMGLWALIFIGLAIFRVARSASLDLESTSNIGLAAMFAFGAIRVKREPLLWTLTLAGLATASLASLFFQTGPLRINIGEIVFALSIWAFVPQASRLQQILRDHPELDFDHRFLSRPSANSSRLKVERRMARKKREVAFMAGLMAMTLLASALLFWFVARAPGLDEFPERFEKAWSAAGSQELRSLPGINTSSRRTDSLNRQLLRRGWVDRRPPLGADPSESIHDRKAELVYRLDDGKLVIELLLTRSRGWEVDSISLPPFTPPTTLKGSLDDFEEAWAAGDLATLAAFWLGAEKEEAMVIYYQRAMTKHGWLPPPPRISARRITDDNGVQSKVEFTIDGVTLETVWEYRHPQWKMRKVAFDR